MPPTLTRPGQPAPGRFVSTASFAGFFACPGALPRADTAGPGFDRLPRSRFVPGPDPWIRVTRLADVEPRDVLLAKLAGAMKASMANAAATLAALPTQMARLAEALRVKQEEQSGAAADADAPAE